MYTCANCSADATFAYSLSATRSIFYCSAHLPRSLRNSPSVGTVTTEKQLEADVQKATKVSSKKTKITAVDSSSSDEADVELNSIEPEPQEEEVADEPQSGNS